MKSDRVFAGSNGTTSRGLHALLAVLLMLLMVFGSIPGPVYADTDDAAYIFGTSEEYSTVSAGEMLTDSFYYTDDWFSQDPAERNDSLALVSMQAVAAAAEESADGKGGDFLRGLGFENVTFVGSGMSDPDACNYLYGTKTVSDGTGTYTLVAVVIQSYTFDASVKEQGWQQNFTVNGENAASGEHFGFAQAADKVTPAIEGLGDSENTRYWIMGQSRGGAIANLIAKRLGDSGRKVYAYTFEAPATVDAGAVSGNYGYIHNYLCRDDIVTKVPMWGMTRYGSTYELKTEETDENIQEELKKLGSEAAGEDVPDSEWIETDVIDYLNERIAARADYSKEHSDSFTDADTGEEVTLTYSYQDTFVKLMGVIFGGGMSGISDAILGNTEALEPAVNDLVEAVKLDGTDEAMPYYYDAAKKLFSILEGAAGKPVDLTVKDLYALLTLVGPFAVDKDYEPIDDPSSNVMGYMGPAVNVAMNAGGMTYSHHFDTLIARLKTLAPAPKMEDVNITIDEPKAGDDVSKAPSEVKEFFDENTFKDAGNTPWIAVEASWDTEDKELQDDSIYYLDITLETVGHTIPEDISLKLNGKSPAKGPFISYDESTGITRVTFEFEIGEPPELTVSFDAAGKTEDPAAITVKRGTALFTQERPVIDDPVTQDGAKYKLKDWYDENGTAWDDVKVHQSLTMHAKWLPLVDQIELSFTVPSLGEAIPKVTVPEDAPYYIRSQECSNPEWDTVTKADMEGEYSYSINVALKDPENSVFAMGEDEWGILGYIGTVTMNGEEVSSDYPDDDEELYYRMDAEYDEGGQYLRVSYAFPVTDEEPVEEALYRFVEGDDSFWIKGSEEPLRFVVKRSEDDASTFAHFTGIEVDGEAVAENAYTAEAGSVVLDLQPAYLESLSEDTHALTVQFDDGTAETEFTVTTAEMVPGEAKTGDDSQPVLWAVVCAGSLLVLLTGYARRRRSI